MDKITPAPQDTPHQDNQFILGYGSLMNSQSAALTGLTSAAIPVRVKNLKRSWSARVFFTSSDGQVHHCTAVTIVQSPTSCGDVCSGVLLAVTSLELAKFDVREKGYSRVQVPLDDVHPLSPFPPPPPPRSLPPRLGVRLFQRPSRHPLLPRVPVLFGRRPPRLS